MTPNALGDSELVRLDAAARRLLDAMPDAVVLVRGGGTMVYVNPQLVELFRIPESDLIGQPIEHLLPDSVRDAHRNQRGGYEANPRIRAMGSGLDLRARRGDGGEFPVEISLSPIDLFGEAFTVANIRDVTERHQAAADRMRMQADLQVRAERERIARDLHDRVIQRLFAVGMSLQRLTMSNDEMVSQRAGHAIDEIDESINELRTAIFTLTRPHDGGVRGRLAVITERFARSLARAPRLVFEGPVDLLAAELADELDAVLSEALSNASRHAGAEHVEVKVAVRGDSLSLRVADDGIGIGSGMLRGSGLDNMAHRAATHHGTLTIEPNSPSGTVVVWRVPLG